MASQSEGAPPRAAIDDGFFAQVRGEAQWITLRGADRGNPPLLILSGPGAVFSRMAPFFAPWEAAFTLVQWDQPGGGATFAKNGEAPLSLDRLAADAEAVAEIALARLDAPKLIVLGVSGGSILGLKLAKARPDLVAAFVGTGQIVHWARQQALGYRLALQAARARGGTAAVATLEQIGRPPYPDIAAEMVFSQHANGLTSAEQAAFASLEPEAAAALAIPPPGACWVPPDLVLPDGRVRGLAAYLALRDEIAAFDAWALGPAFEVPMLFLQGDLDHYTPTAELAAYAAAIDAPAAKVVDVPGGGHSAVFLRQTFLALLQQHALPLGAPKSYV
ncbi:MAG TPA: alpha/beta hydrolase [Caulobacteraceae bacterium]|nr:alpha/beta hydrolase [Caulobacteraceae bacterium]